VAARVLAEGSCRLDQDPCQGEQSTGDNSCGLQGSLQEGCPVCGPLLYYWLPRSEVYHVVLGGRLTMCGLMVKAARGDHRHGWCLTTYRPLGHRICYRCLYARESCPWILRRS